MDASGAPVRRRVVLKLSGEALGGSHGIGIDRSTMVMVCDEIADVVSAGTELAVVIGGGNFFRGLNEARADFDRTTADHIGMLATVMNALALRQGLLAAGVQTELQSAIPMSPIAEEYVRDRAMQYLANGHVVIFAAGTGNPLFTTDTAASLRAIEVNAHLMLKATKVSGVFDADPTKNADARQYATVSFDEVLEKRLAVMDATAIALCREHELPVRVFSMSRRGSLKRAIDGENIGTLVISEATS